MLDSQVCDIWILDSRKLNSFLACIRRSRCEMRFCTDAIGIATTWFAREIGTERRFPKETSRSEKIATHSIVEIIAIIPKLDSLVLRLCKNLCGNLVLSYYLHLALAKPAMVPLSTLREWMIITLKYAKSGLFVLLRKKGKLANVEWLSDLVNI